MNLDCHTPRNKKNWAQTVLCCYCRIFTTLVLWQSAFCQLLYVDLPYMLSGSFCSDTKVHYVMFLQTTQVCQKWLLFEVQSGFWRLCPRDLLWRPETFDQLPTVEVTDIRNLTLETSCQPLFHYCYFYCFLGFFLKVPDGSVITSTVEPQTCFGLWSDLNGFIGS